MNKKMDDHKEFVALLRDARLFIQNQTQLAGFSHFGKASHQAPILENAPKNALHRHKEQQPQAHQNVAQITEPVLPPVKIKMKSEPKVFFPLEKGKWELQPMAQAEEIHVFRKKLSQHVSICDPH